MQNKNINRDKQNTGKNNNRKKSAKSSRYSPGQKKSSKKTVKKSYVQTNRKSRGKNSGEKKNYYEAHKSRRKKKPAGDTVKIIPLGGLNEIGKNMTAIEYDNQILIIDCGMSFPEDDMYGIDVVIPDFSYILENADKLVGMLITHGHEDHIGGIPYLLQKVSLPIYGTKITLALIASKLDEHDIKGDLRPINAGDSIKLGKFTVKALRATHSVADAISLAIKTPDLTIFHTGDFKIDYTPIEGSPINLQEFAEIGKNGVDLMLCDSTNVLRPGFTKSEKHVGETLDRIFRKAKGRIVIATFSSNVHRVQKIIELAVKYGRKFSVSGRSMDKVVNLAQELGYLKIPEGSYVDLRKAKDLPDEELVIITTGSQGEPMSALTRMANGEHRNIKLKEGDMVILSSTPVPGNEKAVSNVVNKLYRKNIEVIYNEIADIHVSGHASQEELKLMHSLIAPKFFMPVHGEARHLVEHAKLAEFLGMDEKNIFILSNGDELKLSKDKALVERNIISSEGVMVDGLGVGDVGNIVLRDRKMLSESGLIIVAATIDKKQKELISGPEIVSRGFVYVKESENLILETKRVSEEAIYECLSSKHPDRNNMKNMVKDAVRKFIYKKTERKPIILTIFLEV